MSFLTILSTLLIGPLKLFFETVYVMANRSLGHPGWAIVVLSLAVNLLVLPLYNRAEILQEEARKAETRLEKGVRHIKRYFSGDERMMILQTYYRQNNYNPAASLGGSVSLLLEVPFFLAAYQFLSGLTMLDGASMWLVRDLSLPDGLLTIGERSINCLPVLMTLVNILSSGIYLRGASRKKKLQLYAMAVFFLVFLYDSPSGLVFYWTLNNLLSLIKTVFQRSGKLGEALGITALVLCISALVLATLRGSKSVVVLRVLLIYMLAIQPSSVMPGIKRQKRIYQDEPNRKLFMLGSFFMAALTGLLIPSAFLAASPQEFVQIHSFYDPVWYAVSACCLAAGTFVIWMGVFYRLADKPGKCLLEKALLFLCGTALVDYMFFGTDLGVLSPELQYENGLFFTGREQLCNLLAIAVLAAGMHGCIRKKSKVLIPCLLAASITLCGMSAWNLIMVRNSVSRIPAQDQTLTETPGFPLSTSGRNVVVIMLDRAMGAYVPYLFNEKPELYEQFDGFTYYSNTISFGRCTNIGAVPLLGGYEYTPVEMNRRSTEPLVEKHNEAVLLMPVVFSEAGYRVTVCDPVYADYQWTSDLRIFDAYPAIDSYITRGYFHDSGDRRENLKRNFFCFSLMKAMPLCLQQYLYDNGSYNQAVSRIQIRDGMHKATGIGESFMDSYSVLTNLPGMTTVTDLENNTFLFLENSTVHEPMLLQEPEYIPAENVDNLAYDQTHTARFTVDGRTLRMETENQMISYQTNMAAMLQLGKWFDHLREQQVYDNTRIILVADHGSNYGHFEELMMDGLLADPVDAEGFYPLLMVKDFGSSGFAVSHAFMTNADVPTLAFQDLIADPVNPFTGKPINDHEKTAHKQLLLISDKWQVSENNGNTFLPDRWGSVHTDLWKRENWEFFREETVLAEHALPGYAAGAER